VHLELLPVYFSVKTSVPNAKILFPTKDSVGLQESLSLSLSLSLSHLTVAISVKYLQDSES
jgi:hypothetical protein